MKDKTYYRHKKKNRERRAHLRALRLNLKMLLNEPVKAEDMDQRFANITRHQNAIFGLTRNRNHSKNYIFIPHPEGSVPLLEVEMKELGQEQEEQDG